MNSFIEQWNADMAGVSFRVQSIFGNRTMFGQPGRIDGPTGVQIRRLPRGSHRKRTAGKTKTTAT